MSGQLMCSGSSSRIEPDGRVVATTPSAGCPTGTVFYASWSAHNYGVDYSDWILRLTSPHPPVGRAHGFGVDALVAERALLEALQNGSVHPSLVADPLTGENGRAAGEGAPVALPELR